MASTDFDSEAACRERYRCDLRQARLYFGVAYPFCLAFSIGKRLMSKGASGWNGKLERRQSVFREAKAAAASIVPFAFR